MNIDVLSKLESLWNKTHSCVLFKYQVRLGCFSRITEYEFLVWDLSLRWRNGTITAGRNGTIIQVGTEKRHALNPGKPI